MAVLLYSEKQERYVSPDARNLEAYPLGRFLLLQTMKHPNKDLSVNRLEFVRYIYSREGAKNVLKRGDIPVSLEVTREALQSIGAYDVKTTPVPVKP